MCSRFLTPAVFVFSGFMQFVQSVPVAEVLATEGNIQVGQSDTLWLIQCSLFLNSGSFSFFWLYSTLDLKWNKKHKVSLTEHKIDARIPPKPPGTKIECIAKEKIMMIVNLSIYLYCNSDVLYSLHSIRVNVPAVKVSLCTVLRPTCHQWTK